MAVKKILSDLDVEGTLTGEVAVDELGAFPGTYSEDDDEQT